MFSKATEYALRAAIFIAHNSSEECKLGLDSIAKGINSPRSFTAKTLQLLTSGSKVVSSSRGPNGGFYMTEKAKNLPIRAILEAMGEDEMLEKCVMGLSGCSDAMPCPLHPRFKPIRLQLQQLFGSRTIRDLANEIAKIERKMKG